MHGKYPNGQRTGGTISTTEDFSTPKLISNQIEFFELTGIRFVSLYGLYFESSIVIF